MRAPNLSPGNTWAVRASSYIPFSFNRPLCVEWIVLLSVMIANLSCCTGTMFLAGTFAFMRWSSAPVLAMPLPCWCCVEYRGFTVVYTLSEFCWVNSILLITLVLPAPSYQMPHVFLPCRLSFVAISIFQASFWWILCYWACTICVANSIPWELVGNGRMCLFCRRFRRCCCWLWPWWIPVVIVPPSFSAVLPFHLILWSWIRWVLNWPGWVRKGILIIGSRGSHIW